MFTQQAGEATERAAAVDQLQIWADRVDVPMVNKGMGADPAAVAFDTFGYLAYDDSIDVNRLVLIENLSESSKAFLETKLP